MTRAVRFHAFGGPQVLQIEDVDVPLPPPGQVRIDVKALGINRAEALMRSGRYIETPRLPSGLGLEAAGVVESVGAGVHGFTIGQLVGLVPPISMEAWPTYAERAIFPAEMLIASPDGLDAPATAATWMSFLTAYGGLVDVGRLGAGDVVALTGASSSVGIAAIQIANLVGAKAIALTRNDRKAAQLKALGAAAVVPLDGGETVERLLAASGSQGIQLAFDGVGGPILSALAAAVRYGGTIVQYGALSGEPTPYPLFDVLAKQLTIRGFLVHHITAHAERLSKARTFILDGLVSQALRPVIDRTYSLDQIVEAHRYLESGAQVGKIVVTI